MITDQQINKLKTQLGHAFDVDDKGNLTLKAHFDIPQFKLIYIESGEFIMGDDKSSSDREKPEHKVKLNSFYMAQIVVTQQLYKAVTGENPSHFKGKNHPVEKVSWYDAVEFCDILNKKLKFSPAFYNIDKNKKDKNNKNESDELKWTVDYNKQGKGFRLPTEAEWEYAAIGASAGSANNYAGSGVLDHVGWFNKNNEYESKPVALKFPNALGLYDMSGNIREWCWDWYDNYNKNELENPIGAKSGTSRVFRGGSWFSLAAISLTANRDYINPDGRDNNLGFRLVFVP